MILDYLNRHMVWSRQTFGPGLKTVGISQHIQKELAEVKQDPTNLEEWIDVIILGFDGAWRSGHTPEQIIKMLEYKQQKNMGRTWPTATNDDEPTEHVRD